MGIAMPYAGQQQSCKVCGSDISYLETINNQRRDLAICGSVECQNVLRQKELMPAAAFEVYLVSYKRVIEQRQKRVEIRDALREGERDQNQRIFARLKDYFQAPELKPENLVVIPTGHVQQVPLRQDRVEKYQVHLEKIIAEAMEYKSVDDVPHDNNHEAHEKLLEQEKRFASQPRLKEISDQFCMLCKGGCCARGQEHAYLSASHIRRLMDQDPDLTPEALMDVYLSRLSDSSTINACINQGPMGCVLPREWRSSTCNQFYCSTIKKYQSGIASDSDITNVAVIQREQSLWNRNYNSEPNAVTSVTILAHNEITQVSVVAGQEVVAVDESVYLDDDSSHEALQK
ncbi:MAG: hypothetical protein R3208_02165 [Ketobacteraceae bacterium]|nr:hypothetical protein [Ketobacteraceae bacterium]